MCRNSSGNASSGRLMRSYPPKGVGYAIYQKVCRITSKIYKVINSIRVIQNLRSDWQLSTGNCISLGLYNDDMETANPLGSHAVIHKLEFLYYIVKNLPPKYNSMLKNCQLLQVYHSVDVKKYGFSNILQPFVDEIRQLEVDGLDIIVDDKTVHVRVTLGQVSGDNLGMHGLLGFVESF